MTGDHSSEYAQALKQKRAWEDLLSTEGWIMVSAFLAEQKKVRVVKVLTEVGLKDKELHFLRGEAATLEMIEKYPKAMLAAALGVIELLRGTDERSSQPASPVVSDSGRFESIHDVDLPADPEQLADDERAGGSTDTWQPNRPAG